MSNHNTIAIIATATFPAKKFRKLISRIFAKHISFYNINSFVSSKNTLYTHAKINLFCTTNTSPSQQVELMPVEHKQSVHRLPFVEYSAQRPYVPQSSHSVAASTIANNSIVLHSSSRSWRSWRRAENCWEVEGFWKLLVNFRSTTGADRCVRAGCRWATHEVPGIVRA